MPTIFINDQFIDSTMPSILATDRGFLLGDGLFETIRVYSGAIPFFMQHWERLMQGAKLLDISIPSTRDQILATINELLITNQLEHNDARIRLTLSRGISEAGLLPKSETQATVLISVAPYKVPGAVNNIIISKIRRNEFSPLCNIKSLNYLDNILALQEAHRENADEALLLNTQENLACATHANVFIVNQEIIYTPKLSDGALPGIMRNRILQIAQKNNIKIQESTISLEQLQSAEEIFLTNSLVGIREVMRFHNHPKSQQKSHALKLLCN